MDYLDLLNLYASVPFCLAPTDCDFRAHSDQERAVSRLLTHKAETNKFWISVSGSKTSPFDNCGQEEREALCQIAQSENWNFRIVFPSSTISIDFPKPSAEYAPLVTKEIAALNVFSSLLATFVSINTGSRRRGVL